VSLAVVVDALGWFARLWASSRNMKISASIVVLLRFSVQPFCRRDAVGGSWLAPEIRGRRTGGLGAVFAATALLALAIGQ
jgi:hypothetical protein